MVDPLRLNPGSQLNLTPLGNTVELPEEEPFMGTGKGPQSTAESKRNDYDLHVVWKWTICGECHLVTVDS